MTKLPELHDINIHEIMKKMSLEGIKSKLDIIHKMIRYRGGWSQCVIEDGHGVQKFIPYHEMYKEPL